MKTTLCLVLQFMIITAFGQDVIAVSKSLNLRTVPAITNNNHRLAAGNAVASPLETAHNNYEHSRVYAADGSVYLLAQTGIKQAKIIFLAPDLTVKWEMAVDGIGLFMGEFGGQLLLTYLIPPQSIKSANEIEYRAALVDKSSGKILLSKIIQKDAEEYMSEIKFFTDPNGKWFMTGSRKTNYKFKLTFAWPDEKFDGTQSFTLTSFNEKLEPLKKITLNGSFLKNVFIGCGSNAHGDVIVASCDNEKVIAEKFLANSNYEKAELLSQEQALRNKSEVDPLFYVSPTKDNEVFLSMRIETGKKTSDHNFIRFDFDKKKTFAFNEVYDKAMQDEYEKASIQQVNTNFRKPDFKINDLSGSQILRWKDKTILLKEAFDKKSYAGSMGAPGSIIFHSRDLVVQVFSDENKLLKTFLIPKYFHHNFMIGMISGAFVKDDILYTISSHVKTSFITGTASTLVTRIDLNKLVPLTAFWVKSGSEMSDIWSITEGGATILFKDGFVINNITAKIKGLTRADADMQFLKVAY